MNTRRLTRIVVPLAALAACVLLVHHVLRNYIASFDPSRRHGAEGGAAVEGGGGSFEGKQYGHLVSENVDITRKDETGRITMRIVAEKVLHYPDNRSRIVNPIIIYYSEAGETLALVGDEADILRKGNGGLELGDIRSGTVRGDVVLSHDRGTPENSLDDFLVGLDDLSFDNHTDEMRTEGPVILVGDEISLTARRMLIVMDRDTGRVSAMTFYEDILASLKAGDRLRMGLARMPGEPEPEADPSNVDAGSPEAGTGDTEDPAPSPTAGTGGGDDDEGPVLWRIDAAGDVDARQLDQRLTAPRVGLYSEMARPLAESREGAAVPAEGNSGDVPAPGDRSAAGGSGAPSAPSEPGESDAETDSGAPLMVIADGPLIITPVDADELALMGPRRHELAASGGRVTLRDGDLRVEGDEVVYNVRSGEGRIAGDEGGVALRQPGRLDLTGESLRFSRRDGTAVVSGPGRLKASLDAPGLMAGPDAGHGGGSERHPAGGDPGPEAFEASWLQSMKLHFGRTDDLSGEALPEVLRAEFHGSAAVKQRGGVLKGDDLAIDFHPRRPGRRDVAVPLWLTLAEEADPERGLVPLDIPKGTITSWHVGPGADVETGDVLATIDVGGAIEAVASPADGRVARVLRAAGSDVLPGDVVAVVETPGRQAVRRLTATKDVYLAGTDPVGTEGGPLGRVGSIACRDELIVDFVTEANGGSIPKTLDARGAVRVRDAEGEVRAERLHTKFARTEEGDVDVLWMEAQGDVRVDRGETRAEGDYVLRDVPGGRLVLVGRPATASRGTGSDRRHIVGPQIAFLEGEGRAEVRGKGELTVPTTTDLRGRPREAARPLTVHWSKGMAFREERNFAQFAGTVAVHTGGSRLNAEDLWILFKDVPPEPAGETATTPEDVPDEDKADEEAALAGLGELNRLLEGKAVERIVTQGPTDIVEQETDPDGGVRFRFELIGEDLTFLDEDRKAYTRKAGRLWVLARDVPAEGEPPGPPLPPPQAERLWERDVPDGYSRIGIGWTDEMAFDERTYRAYFSGGVETDYVGRAVSPAGGAASGGAAGGARRSRVRVESGDLQVAFVEAPDEGADVDPADPQTLAVDKFVADKGVDLTVDDRQGSAHRLYYQRKPEMLRLYSGPGRDARLWRENESEQEFDLVVAREITYYPATGRIDVKGQKVISGATESGSP